MRVILLSCIALPGLFAQNVPELIYYKFDVAGTTVANEASAPVGTNPAPILGQTIGGTGMSGTALVGNGLTSTSNYVNTGWNASFTGNWTIAMWVNNISTPSTTYYYFGTTTSSFRCFIGGVAPSGGILLRGTGVTDVPVAGIIPGPSMIHFVYNGTDIKAYLNGALVNTVAQGTISIVGTNVFKVGGYSSSNSIISGSYLDEFRLYNRALDAGEIGLTWNATLPLFQVPDMMYYRFDVAGTSVLNEASAPVGTNPAPILGQTIGGAGLSGTALVGNGLTSTSNYVNTGWNTSLTGDWTIAMWVNNIPTPATTYYYFGTTTSSFRCFIGGVAPSGGILLRGTGVTDVPVTGIIPGPSMIHFVYNGTDIKAYVNGALVNTVAQGTISIIGTNVFKVGGYSSSNSIPSGSLMDEFRMYGRALDAVEIAATWNVPLLPPPAAPGSPSNPNPADGATGIAYSGNLTWDFGGNTDTYDLWFGPAGSMTKVVDNQPAGASGSYPYAGLSNNTTYEWQVVGRNSAKAETTGPLWSFTTMNLVTTYPYIQDFETFIVGANATGYLDDWYADPTNTTSLYRWNVDEGGTPSVSTGPNVDHTTGTSTGNYIFTEASSGAAGAIAYVYTCWFDISPLTAPSIEFWYHMYGSTMGDLHLDIHSGGAWIDDITPALIGQQQIAQADPYLNRIVDLSAYAGQTVQFRFRAVRSSNYYGDMAVDDFKVYNAVDPGPPVNPNPANNAVSVPINGNLTWDFGALTDTYDLWFGPSGSMTKVVDNQPAGASGSYPYSGLSYASGYQWQVIARNSAKSETAGPVWNFTTACANFTLPHSENFDASSDWPPCWSEGGNLDVWSISTSWSGSNPPTGNHVYSDYSPYDQGFVYSPYFDLTGVTDPWVKFFHYWRADYSTGTQDGYFEASFDGATWYVIDEWHHLNPATFEGREKYQLNIFTWWSSLATQVMFRWNVTHNNDWYWQWDDFGIQDGPYIEPGLWTGAVDSDWWNAGNWDGGLIPDVYTPDYEIVIPGGLTNYPILTSGNAYGNSMTIQSGGSFTMAGGSLYVDSFFDVLGTFDMNNGLIKDMGFLYSEVGSVLNFNGGTFMLNTWMQSPASYWADGTVTFAGGLIKATGSVRFGFGIVNMTGPFTMYVGGDYRIQNNTCTDGTVILTGEELPGGTFVVQASTWSAGYDLYAWNLYVNTTDPTTVYAFSWNDATSIYNNAYILNAFKVAKGTVTTYNGAGYVVGVDVAGACQVYPGANFQTNTPTTVNLQGQLRLLANSTGYASWIDGSNVSYTKDPSTAQVYVPATMWHMITPPISNATTNLFLGQYLQEFSETTNAWADITAASIALDVMKGYSLWTSFTHNIPWVGLLNTGALSVSLTRNNAGWNSVGNPYPSPIDWYAATGWTKTNVADAIYIESNGSWATFINGVGTNGGSQYIAPGQGFFVECTDAGGGVLGVNRDVQTHVRAPFFKETIANLVRLEASGNSYTDETVVYFNDQATAGFDYSYDAHKMFTSVNEMPQLYSLANGGMSINALASADMVALGFTAGVSGSYTIAATEINDLGMVILEDLANGKLTDLTGGSYTFNYVAGENAARFILHFAPLSVPEIGAGNVQIYSYGNNIYVNVPENVNGQVVVYNMLGQVVMSAAINSALNVLTVDEAGSYIVKVLGDKKVVTEKVMVE
jgi:hypothetical protein